MKYKVKNVDTSTIGFFDRGKRINLLPGETVIVSKRMNGSGLKTVEEVKDFRRARVVEQKKTEKKIVEDDSSSADAADSSAILLTSLKSIIIVLTLLFCSTIARLITEIPTNL